MSDKRNVPGTGIVDAETLKRFEGPPTGDALPEAPKTKPMPLTEESTAYGNAVLEREISKVATALQGARHKALIAAATALGEIVAGKQLQRAVVEERLRDACAKNGMLSEGREHEVERAIRDGIEKGLLNPRCGDQRPRTSVNSPNALERQPLVNRSVDVIAPELMVEEPSWIREEDSSGANLPEILVPGAHITDDGEVIEIGADDFVLASVPALPPGVIYRRAKLVGEIQGEEGRRSFVEAEDARLRIQIDANLRLVRWVLPRRGKGDSFKKYVPCTSDQAALIRQEASTSPAVRELKLLTSHPVATGVEFKIVQPGFNAACGTFYDPSDSLRNLVPLRDMVRARKVLLDLVVDFPFKTEADRQNFFGLLLTPIVWPAMPTTNVPMHLVLSSLERTGKTKLASEVVGGIILGQSAPTQPMTADVELDKRITSLLLRGGDMIVFDNINTTHSQLESSVLAMILTSRSYTGRLLGRSETVTFPNPMLTVMATANNPRMNGELAKRVIPIALQPSSDHPEARIDFKHPDLSPYLASVRENVLAALLGIVEEWNTRQRPAHPKPLGGFEEWSRVIGGMLSVAGFTAWGSNLLDWQNSADPDGEDLREFVTAWAERPWPTGKQTARELFDLAVQLGLFPVVMLAKEGRGQMTAFGMRVLSAKRDTPVGGHVIRATGSGASSLYYLEKSGV